MRDIDKKLLEDDIFWFNKGEQIVSRNLWISINCLFCSFAIWMYWGVITVHMLNVGYNFSQSNLFSLIAIAGLSGATLRIPNCFFVQLCGGRYTLFFTVLLLIIPALGTGLALQNKDTSLLVFQFLALLSGIGGGHFASSMANINLFFPKYKQGLAFGLNAGLGNFGISIMQIIVPLVVTYAAFNIEGSQLISSSGSLLSTISAGHNIYIQNTGYVWLLFIIPLLFVCWFAATNIRLKNEPLYINSPLKAFSLIVGMLLIGLIFTAIGSWLIFSEGSNGSGFHVSKEVVLVLVISATLICLKLFSSDIGRQYTIFKNKHVWVMSVVYTMTFGSFIGFTAIFPLTIKLIFGYKHIIVAGELTHNIINSNAPSALMYAWMGPFIGALTRPIGGWLGDKFGGAVVTQICCIIMILSALGVSYYMNLAFNTSNPEEYFLAFFGSFLVLFLVTGMANGSTFKTIAVLFPGRNIALTIGFTSAIAAYGAFYIPCVFDEQITIGEPGIAFINFAVFYTMCLFVNWWFYLRKTSVTYNP